MVGKALTIAKAQSISVRDDQLQEGHVYHTLPSQGPSQKRSRKTVRYKRSGRARVKQCLLDISRTLNS